MIIDFKTIIVLFLIFIFSLIVIWLTRVRMGFNKKKMTKKECINLAKKKHRFSYIIYLIFLNIVLPVLVIIILFCIFFYARLHTSVDNYIYLKNNLATQRNIEVLFSEPTIDPGQDEKIEEYIKNLHIPERFVGKSIDATMYDFFFEDLSTVFINGTKDINTSPLTIEFGDTEYDYLDDKNIQNAKRYKRNYNGNHDLASLYQYGRELSEFKPTGSDFPFELNLAIMSDSLRSFESFLQYENRNIGDSNLPVVIDAYWISFLSGKMFLRNSKLANKSDKGANYSNCLSIEAFVCFEISLNQIDTNNKNYAKISYYIGDSGESLLSKIDRNSEPELYNRIGNKAMWGYQNALKYYEDNPDFYAIEPNIEKIRTGINTLTDLGISAE